MPAVSFTPALSDEYQHLFDSCQIRPERANEVNKFVSAISDNRQRYQNVGEPLTVPWFFVAVTHALEASLNFKCHLHNGDPLTARTVHEPPNRPASGQPPFTWEASATDALMLKKLEKIKTWTLPRSLYQLEGYNGFGYRTKHPEVLTPYLWSFSQHYASGKYIADGTFSATAVSKQCGAAVLLRRMAEIGLIEFTPAGTVIVESGGGGGETPMTFDDFGPLIRYSKTKKSVVVEELQRMLNTLPGIFVKVDGIAGDRTSEAFRKVTGHFLVGDPRADEDG